RYALSRLTCSPDKWSAWYEILTPLEGRRRSWGSGTPRAGHRQAPEGRGRLGSEPGHRSGLPEASCQRADLPPLASAPRRRRRRRRDERRRECLAWEVGGGMNAAWVIEALQRQRAARGAPVHIRSDNGPEFIAAAIRGWLRGGRGEVR